MYQYMALRDVSMQGRTLRDISMKGRALRDVSMQGIEGCINAGH